MPFHRRESRAADGRTVATTAGVAAALLGGLVLLARLSGLLGDDAHTFPRLTTAAMFLAAGLALTAAVRREPTTRPLRLGAAAIVLAIAVGCGIDQIISGESVGQFDGGGVSPLPTVVAFLAVGTALLCYGATVVWPAYLATAIAGVIAFTGLSGYALGLRPENSVLAGMAPVTLIGLTGVSAGLLSLWPHLPPFSWLALNTSGARLARRLVPVMIAVPMALAAMLPYWSGWTGLPEEAGLAVAVALLGTILITTTAISVRFIDGAELLTEEIRREAHTAVRASEERFRTLALEMPAGIVQRDATGTISFANDEAYRIFGVEPGEDLQARATDMAHPEDFGRALAAMRRTMETGEPYEQESRIIRRDGEIRWVHVRGSRLDDEDGTFTSYLSIVTDVTDRRSAQLAERSAHEQFRVAFDHAPMGIAVVGLDGAIQRVNPAMSRIFGHTEPELLALDPASLLPDGDAAGVASLFAALGRDGDTVEAVRRMVHAGGQELWVELHATLVRDGRGEPDHVLAQLVDVTERHDYERRLRHLADHDALTGLLNRRGFERRLADHMARVRRYGPTGSLLMLDLDGFKAVNDTHGHAAGDALIAGVATALRDRLRETDVVARLGGDEFAVILPGEAGVDAGEVAAALVGLVRATTAGLAGGERVTVSVGVADFEAGISPDEVLIRGDRAMYAAKAAGKDRVERYAAPAGPPVAPSRR